MIGRWNSGAKKRPITRTALAGTRTPRTLNANRDRLALSDRRAVPECDQPRRPEFLVDEADQVVGIEPMTYARLTRSASRSVDARPSAFSTIR
jgi:hypothetical protein